MTQISKLTKAQEQKLIEFREEWLQIGLCTDPADWDRAEKAISQMYTFIGWKPPQFVRCASPLDAQKKINPNGPMEYTGLWGQMDVYWVAFKLFPHLHIKPIYSDDQLARLNLWADICKSISWWWSYENICFMSDRYREIHRNESLQLHRDGGPAIRWADDWCLYFLNGVRVTKEIATTPPDELNPKLLITEVNASVRREIMNRIGAKRALEKLGSEVIDEKTITYHRQKLVMDTPQGPMISYEPYQTHYELVLLDLGDKRRWPFLKMSNPSVPDEVAVEGVPHRTATVDEALVYRNSDPELPYVLT